MKLKKTNNWEYFEYSFEGKKIPETMDGVITVRFPDGTIESINYNSIEETVQVNDMGSSYPVTRYRLEGVIDYHGVQLKVDIDKLDVQSLTHIESLKFE